MRYPKVLIILSLTLISILVLMPTLEVSAYQSSVFRKSFERPSQPADPPTPPPAPGLNAREQEMFNLLNEERISRGLRPLQVDMNVTRQARLKSQDMINNNYFSHYSPTYGYFSTQLRNAGINFRYAGENIAGARSVAQAHQSLMNSQGHRANILRSGYTHVGIGIVDGGPHGTMYTQIFIAR